MIQPLTLRLQVPDIRCANCALKIEDGLREVTGIHRCRTNVASKQVIIELDPDTLTSEAIFDRIRDLGFQQISDAGPQTDTTQLEAKTLLARLGVAGIGAMQVMMFALVTYVAGEGGVETAYVKLMQWASFALATPVAFYSAVPFYRNAYRDLSHQRVGMDVPVSLAILSAYGLSTVHMLTDGEVYFDSVCMFAFLLLLGRFLELRSRQKYQDNMTLADRCLPEMSELACGSRIKTADLKIDDLVVVRAGSIIPVDGVVSQGGGYVSEAAFTGEAKMFKKGKGSNVLAGSELQEGEVTVLCQAENESSVLAGMSRLYQNAMLYKPGFALLADSISRYFVSAILLIALASGGVWYFLGNPEWFVVMITVLVVSCPCALSLATPIAYTVAVTALKQRGVVVRSGSFLEKLERVSHIVFDKTGTLTEGKLKLQSVQIVAEGWSTQKVLDICTALEHGNKHPIAKVFQTETPYVATDLLSHVGNGVIGTIDGIRYRFGKPLSRTEDADAASGTVIELSIETRGTLLARVVLNDDVRQSAFELFHRLDPNVQTTLLSGDGQSEVARITDLLRIQHGLGEQTPEAKLNFIRGQQKLGQTVLMVGDGFNDAAAMAAADAAIAVSPVDILVQEAADASLLRQDITRINELMDFARALKRVVRQNVTWAILYNMSVIPLAVTGLLEPWMAALGMSLSSLLVVLNAGRLQRLGG